MNINEAKERISEMEAILNRASGLIADLEKNLDGFEELQSDVQKLEAYYTGKECKNDLKLDEEGKLPGDLKRGVLSEDGICNLLDKNREILERIGIER